MRIEQVMTHKPRTASADANLAEVAKVMGDSGCGVIPLINADGELEGIVTDRDIALETAKRNCAPSRIRAIDLARQARRPVVTCEPEDDVHDVLNRMRQHHVRRLPVVKNKRVTGIVSLRDIAHVAKPDRSADINTVEINDTFQAVSVRQPAAAGA